MAISEEVIATDVHQDAERVMSDALCRTASSSWSTRPTRWTTELLPLQAASRAPRWTVGGELHHGLRLEDARGLDPVSSGDVQVTGVLSAYSTLLRFKAASSSEYPPESWAAESLSLPVPLHVETGGDVHDGVELNAHPREGTLREASRSQRGGAPRPGSSKTSPARVSTWPRQGGEWHRGAGRRQHRAALETARAFFLRMLALPATSVTRLEGGRLFRHGPLSAGGDRLRLHHHGAEPGVSAPPPACPCSPGSSSSSSRRAARRSRPTGGVRCSSSRTSTPRT